MQKLQNPVRSQDDLTTHSESFGELLSDLASQSADLIRDEIFLAKQEVNERLQSYKTAMLQMIGGFAIGFLALMSLCAALIIWLGESLGPGLAATLIGAGLIIIAALLMLLGRSNLNNLNEKSKPRIKSLEENTEWLK